MFGKTAPQNYDDCVPMCAEPTEMRLTESQWNDRQLAQMAEDTRQSTLLHLLRELDESIADDGCDSLRISCLSEAYKNVRGY